MNVSVTFNHGDSSLGEQPEGLRKYRMFHFKNTRCETLRRICRQDRHCALKDDRSMIVFFINNVHRRPCQRLAGCQHCLVNAEPVHAFPPNDGRRAG